MFSVTTEPLENCEVLMTVQLDDQQEEQLLKSAAARISRHVQIRGFRPGKAPYHLVVRRVGEAAIREEALEELSESVFRQALEQAGLVPFAPAQMQDVTWSPLVMKVRVPIEPIIDLGDYRALRMEPEPVEVSPEEVEQELANLQAQHAHWRDVERRAQPGDRVIADVEYRIGDQLLPEVKDAEYDLAESPEDSSELTVTKFLLDSAAGDERTFTFTFSADEVPPKYAEYVGKEVTVLMKVRRVQEKELYPLDDDFAQMIGDYNTLDELKLKLAEDLRRRKENEAKLKLADQALDHIITHAPRVEWHRSLEDRLLEQILEEQDQALRQRNLNLDAYLSAQQQTRDQLREELRPEIQKMLRRSLVLSELFKREKLGVETHEVLDQIDFRAFLAGPRADEVRQALSTTEGVRDVYRDLRYAKLRQRIWDIVTGRLTEAEPETTAAEEAQPAAQLPELQPSEPAQAPGN